MLNWSGFFSLSCPTAARHFTGWESLERWLSPAACHVLYLSVSLRFGECLALPTPLLGSLCPQLLVVSLKASVSPCGWGRETADYRVEALVFSTNSCLLPKSLP